jgi:hypothetical protein
MISSAAAVIAVVAYYLAAPRFLSASYASELSLIVGITACTLFFLLFAVGLTAKKEWRLSVLPIALFVSVLMGLVWLLAAKEPILYLLHAVSGKDTAQVTEVAVSNGQWARSCRGRLNFPAPGLSARVICRAPATVARGLIHSGKVVMTGEASTFGMSVERFSVASER